MLNNSVLSIRKKWVNLLKKFTEELVREKQLNTEINHSWQEINTYFSSTIMNFRNDNLSSEQVNLWQKWQTETHRLIRLLNTDLLFLNSAKESATKENRLSAIQEKLHLAIQLTENLQQSSDT